MKSKLFFTFLFSIISISLSAQSFVEDIDGNQYVTTTIGTQTWMAQNLRVTKYNNGDPIPNVQDAASWSAQNTGAWSYYNNDSVYDYDLGKLYKFYATEDVRGLCPDGWRMPTREDWEELRDYLGGEEIAASGLKATGGAYYWTEPMVGDNQYGFNGVGGGVRTESGSYNSLGTRGIWWTSTKGNTGSIAVAMYNDSNELKIIGILRGDGASVRCIQSNQDNGENPNYNNGGVPQEGLELYFEFDGNLDDDSPNGIILQQSVSDPASMYTDDKNGGVMSALNLNGIEDNLYYDGEFDETKLSTSFTISAWAKINAPMDYSSFSIFEIGSQKLGANNFGIHLFLDENYLTDCGNGQTYRLFYRIMENGNGVTKGCLDFNFLSNWNQYTVVYETGVSKLYINGSLIGINYDSVTEVLFENNDFYILNRNNNSNIPSRSIDKLGVWSRAFSPEEVRGLYDGVNYNRVSWNSVETVTHGFNSSFTEAFANNNTDKVYKLKVSGTYGIANGTPHRDAAYNINNENLITGCDSNWQLDLQCPPPPPTAPEYYSDNHEYEYFLGYGTTIGSEVTFFDGNYNDNAGSLTFELFEGTINNIQEPNGIPYYIPTDELTAFYGFDGTADDQSNFANHGTVNGPSPTEDRFGTFSSAYYFDGVDDYIQVPNAEGNQINGDYSISFWYNPGEGYGSGNNFGSYNHIIGKWGSSDASFVVSVQTDGTLAYGNYDHSQPSAQRSKTIYSPNSLNIDEWVHVALTLQGQEMKMYINGTEVAGRIDGVVPQLSNKQLDIGFESGERGFINGSLDELGIWKRALNEQEIRFIYYGGNPPIIPSNIPTDSLIAWYPFNSNPDNEATAKNNGTNYGATLVPDRFNAENSAYYFEGEKNTGDYIDLGTAIFKNPQELSVSIWINPSRFVNNNLGQIWAHGYGRTESEIGISHQPNDMLDFAVRLEDYSLAQCLVDIVYDEWSNYVFIYNSTEIKLYHNTNLVCSYTHNSKMNIGNGRTVFGKFPEVDENYYRGSLDDVGIWNRELTENEIRAIYNDQSNSSKLSNRTLIVSDVYTKEGVKLAHSISFDTLTYADSLVGFQFELPVDPSISVDSIYFITAQDLNIEASYIGNSANIAVSSSQFITSYENVLDIFFTPYQSGIFEIIPTNVKLNSNYTNNIQSGTLTVDPFIFGDVDSNGEVDNYDAGVILHHTVGSELLPMDGLRWWESGPWFDWRTKAADVDADGHVLAMDAVYILQYIVGLISEFPIITNPVESVTVELTDSGLLFSAPEAINGFNIYLPDLEGVEYFEPILQWENASKVVHDEDGMGIAIASSVAKEGSFLEIPLSVTSVENIDVIMTAFSNNTEAQLKVVVNSSMVNNETSTGLPQQYTLSQNYPNPFNPSTQIEYALPKATQVTLEVFNSVGQKVMELVNGQKSAGYHTATFNASALSSGVYLYKLTTPSFTETKKMLLIK